MPIHAFGFGLVALGAAFDQLMTTLTACAWGLPRTRRRFLRLLPLIAHRNCEGSSSSACFCLMWEMELRHSRAHSIPCTPCTTCTHPFSCVAHTCEYQERMMICATLNLSAFLRYCTQQCCGAGSGSVGSVCFGPPGSGSINTRYGSGSFCLEQK